jgi:hypothetical protein
LLQQALDIGSIGHPFPDMRLRSSALAVFGLSVPKKATRSYEKGLALGATISKDPQSPAVRQKTKLSLFN